MELPNISFATCSSLDAGQLAKNQFFPLNPLDSSEEIKYVQEKCDAMDITQNTNPLRWCREINDSKPHSLPEDVDCHSGVTRGIQPGIHNRHLFSFQNASKT